MVGIQRGSAGWSCSFRLSLRLRVSTMRVGVATRHGSFPIALHPSLILRDLLSGKRHSLFLSSLALLPSPRFRFFPARSRLDFPANRPPSRRSSPPPIAVDRGIRYSFCNALPKLNP